MRKAPLPPILRRGLMPGDDDIAARQRRVVAGNRGLNVNRRLHALEDGIRLARSAAIFFSIWSSASKSPNNLKLSDCGVRRGTCMVGGKAAVEVPVCQDDARSCSRQRMVTDMKEASATGFFKPLKELNTFS